MTLELANTTDVLLQEIGCGAMTRRDVAQSYALAIRSSHATDWAKVNAAIMTRWSRSALDYIKRLAWSGKCFRGTA